MRITTEPGRCIGAGQCVLTAPELFDQGDDGTVRPLVDIPGTESEELAREAAHLCPSRAITLTGGQRGTNGATS